jgi:hypothetical protein
MDRFRVSDIYAPGVPDGGSRRSFHTVGDSLVWRPVPVRRVASPRSATARSSGSRESASARARHGGRPGDLRGMQAVADQVVLTVASAPSLARRYQDDRLDLERSCQRSDRRGFGRSFERFDATDRLTAEAGTLRQFPLVEPSGFSHPRSAPPGSHRASAGIPVWSVPRQQPALPGGWLWRTQVQNGRRRGRPRPPRASG